MIYYRLVDRLSNSARREALECMKQTYDIYVNIYYINPYYDYILCQDIEDYGIDDGNENDY